MTSFGDGLDLRYINGIACWLDGYGICCDENIDFPKSRFRKINASPKSCLLTRPQQLELIHHPKSSQNFIILRTGTDGYSKTIIAKMNT